MKKWKEKKTKRLAIAITEEEHKIIKVAASEKKITISNYVLQAVVWRLKEEKK